MEHLRAESGSQEGDVGRIEAANPADRLSETVRCGERCGLRDLGEGTPVRTGLGPSGSFGLLWVGGGDPFERGLPVSRRQGGRSVNKLR